MKLYVREIGTGRPVVVLHGGPDFDHSYLIPELDRLAESCRLVYYDQRGRGRSAAGVRAEDVSIQSEVADLDKIREHLERASMAVLGHSWGGVLAMEYALRHPQRVSHLILMNAAPASYQEAQHFRAQLRAARPPSDVETMQVITSSPAYQAGDLNAEADYYRIHFRPTVPRPADLEQILGRLRQHFTPGTVLLARAIERRLYEQTWLSGDYDLIPRLRHLDVPTLVLHADRDFVPVDMAARIATAIHGSRFVVLTGTGHFSYLEQPDQVHRHIAALIDTA